VNADFEGWTRSRTTALLRAAYLLTGDQHSAEDLVQMTLEKVAGRWRGIIDNPDAYARRAMYRLAVSGWRRRRLHEVVMSVAPEVEGLDMTNEVEVRLIVRAAMQSLTPSQRAVLVLRYFEDLTELETAAVLNRSVGTVKSQTHKALRSLKSSAPQLTDLVVRRLPADA
jgi:RNA polymerase sigma-70 factor (sigma-E family)